MGGRNNPRRFEHAPLDSFPGKVRCAVQVQEEIHTCLSKLIKPFLLNCDWSCPRFILKEYLLSLCIQVYCSSHFTCPLHDMPRSDPIHWSLGLIWGWLLDASPTYSQSVIMRSDCDLPSLLPSCLQYSWALPKWASPVMYTGGRQLNLSVGCPEAGRRGLAKYRAHP